MKIMKEEILLKKGTQKKTNYFFVKLLDSYSKHAMAKEYNITEKNLGRWKQRESLLLQLKLKRLKRRIIGDEKHMT